MQQRIAAAPSTSFAVLHLETTASGQVQPRIVVRTLGVSATAEADALVAAIPVGRIGQPEDLWLAVKFVLECDYFNGRTIDVDGGLGM